ncbi:MAG: septal ring lytic transglycosylase RlpA family protein [Bradymonadaceae bacterium]|nr:septal ring lytic transglycosylase RlpA family protein [Lujinxingiaceae bacterium]
MRGLRLGAALVCGLLIVCGCGRSYEKTGTKVPQSTAEPLRSVQGPDGRRHTLMGKASYYHDKFHGRKTASGDRYDKGEFTAAHKTLPFQSIVRVTNSQTRKSVVVRISDRGPFTKGRVIDLSYAAADDLDMLDAGIVPVFVEVLYWGDGKRLPTS